MVMQPKLINLTRTERKVLQYLALGSSYSFIAQKLGISGSNVNTTCFNIRRKTGIHCTRDQMECSEYLKGNPYTGHPVKNPLPPTATQIMAMESFAEGRNYEAVARDLSSENVQTVKNFISQGCKRAGILYSGRGEERRQAIKAWLAQRKAALAPAAPSDNPEDY